MATAVEEFVNVLNSFANDAEDVKLYRGYSGRGMYGARCVGLSARYESDIDAVLRDVVRFDEDQRYEAFLDSKRIDSLGLGVIVYFPAAHDDDEDEDEE